MRGRLMSKEEDVLRIALEEMRIALRYKKMCDELLQHLIGSVRYLQSYSKKYNIPLPNEDAILRSTEKAADLIEQITNPTNRQLTGRNINREDNSSEILVRL